MKCREELSLLPNKPNHEIQGTEGYNVEFGDFAKENWEGQGYQRMQAKFCSIIDMLSIAIQS
jgi:hypothetical protein